VFGKFVKEIENINENEDRLYSYRNAIKPFY